MPKLVAASLSQDEFNKLKYETNKTPKNEEIEEVEKLEHFQAPSYGVPWFDEKVRVYFAPRLKQLTRDHLYRLPMHRQQARIGVNSRYRSSLINLSPLLFLHRTHPALAHLSQLDFISAARQVRKQRGETAVVHAVWLLRYHYGLHCSWCVCLWGDHGSQWVLRMVSHRHFCTICLCVDFFSVREGCGFESVCRFEVF